MQIDIISQNLEYPTSNTLTAKSHKLISIEILVMGQKKSEAIKLLLQKAEIDHLTTPDEYMVDYDHFIRTSMTKCAELPGASKLINYFYDQKLPLAICTGSVWILVNSWLKDCLGHGGVWSQDLDSLQALAGEDSVARKYRCFYF